MSAGASCGAEVDALAFESHFLDHLAPLWALLPTSAQGRFLVAPELVERASWSGITAEPIDPNPIRATPQVGPRFGGQVALVASIGDIKIGRRLGYGPFAFLEHGAGQGYDTASAVAASYAGGPDRADNELFLCPNEYSAARWRRAYPGARVEVVGSPRLDGLPRRGPGPGPVVAISFHGDWPNVAYGGNALGDFAPIVSKLAERFTVIGHAHPGKGWGDRLREWYQRQHIPFVADFDDVCRQADVYVCDNSTTIFEFASTGRPVVLMNARHWSRKAGPGLRFWDAAHVGINVDVPDLLPEAIERALEDSPDKQRAREHALDFVYQPRHGGAERAASVVMDWLATRGQAAA